MACARLGEYCCVFKYIAGLIDDRGSCLGCLYGSYALAYGTDCISLILLHIQTIQSILYLRMYMRHCHAYILVNKSHNNAVITNNFFLLVYVIILFALYILHTSIKNNKIEG